MVQIKRVTEDRSASAVFDRIREELYDFNKKNIPNAEYEALNFIVTAEAGELIAGLLSHRFGEAVSLEILWVHETYRYQGIGNKLLQEMERAAKASGAKRIHLDTHDFQAPDFYLKNGYVTFGVLEHVPVHGVTRYYMRKEL